MLFTLVNGFLNTVELIIGLVTFLIQMIKDIIYVVQLCTEFVTKIPMLFSWMPSPILSVIIIIFTIAVIYKVLGREG